MTGILRTFDEHDRVSLHNSIENAASAITSIHGCNSEVVISLGAPVLENDMTLTAAVATWIEHAGLTPSPPLRSCGADDFSYYCAHFPSLMALSGLGRVARMSPAFTIRPSCLPIAASARRPE